MSYQSGEKRKRFLPLLTLAPHGAESRKFWIRTQHELYLHIGTWDRKVDFNDIVSALCLPQSNLIVEIVCCICKSVGDPHFIVR